MIVGFPEYLHLYCFCVSYLFGSFKIETHTMGKPISSKGPENLLVTAV